MLQVPFIRENKALVIERLTKRNFDATNIVEDVIKLDEDRRKTQAQLDNVLSESNSLSKEIGNLFKSGEAQKANLLKEKTGQLKNQSKELEDTLNAISDALNELLYTIPNVPHESVPTGNTDEDNEEVFRAGDIPDLGVNALPHWELAKKYDIIDFELGNKIAGSGFPVYKGKGARLHLVLEWKQEVMVLMYED
jgi:seryl-tRNA synthetase